MDPNPPSPPGDATDPILRDLLEWGRDLPGFEPAHASDALTLIRGYTDVLPDKSGVDLYALDLACIFWLDDRFDTRLARTDELMDWQALVEATGPRRRPLRSIEALALASLKRRMAQRTRSRADLKLWSATARDSYRAWHTEERLSRGQLELSYAEYLDNGVSSTTVPHLVATASLLYDLGMPLRLRSGPLASLVRNLAIVSRLQNDLVSVDRDRREGCRANALLLLELHMSREQARQFVEAERAGYERMLNRDAAQLGPADPFARLARAMVDIQEHWGRNQTARYDTPTG